MSVPNDGGPAFPCLAFLSPHDPAPSNFPGMSLRDWFAGQALVGIINHQSESLGPWSEEAEIAYLFADAMLAAREKKGEE